jgi:hypothetical protein
MGRLTLENWVVRVGDERRYGKSRSGSYPTAGFSISDVEIKVSATITLVTGMR